MPQIDLAEDAFVAADPGAVRARVAVPGFVREFWPDLKLRVTEDRGREGVRFAVTGPLTGTAEVWLEEWADGVIVHLYLRADPGDGPWRPRRAGREVVRRRRLARPALWRAKDGLEAGRRPGDPARR